MKNVLKISTDNASVVRHEPLLGKIRHELRLRSNILCYTLDTKYFLQEYLPALVKFVEFGLKDVFDFRSETLAYLLEVHSRKFTPRRQNVKNYAEWHRLHEELILRADNEYYLEKDKTNGVTTQYMVGKMRVAREIYRRMVEEAVEEGKVVKTYCSIKNKTVPIYDAAQGKTVRVETKDTYKLVRAYIRDDKLINEDAKEPSKNEWKSWRFPAYYVGIDTTVAKKDEASIRTIALMNYQAFNQDIYVNKPVKVKNEVELSKIYFKLDKDNKITEGSWQAYEENEDRDDLITEALEKGAPMKIGVWPIKIKIFRKKLPIRAMKARMKELDADVKILKKFRKRKHPVKKIAAEFKRSRIEHKTEVIDVPGIDTRYKVAKTKLSKHEFAMYAKSEGYKFEEFFFDMDQFKDNVELFSKHIAYKYKELNRKAYKSNQRYLALSKLAELNDRYGLDLPVPATSQLLYEAGAELPPAVPNVKLPTRSEFEEIVTFGEAYGLDFAEYCLDAYDEFFDDLVVTGIDDNQDTGLYYKDRRHFRVNPVKLLEFAEIVAYHRSKFHKMLDGYEVIDGVLTRVHKDEYFVSSGSNHNPAKIGRVINKDTGRGRNFMYADIEDAAVVKTRYRYETVTIPLPDFKESEELRTQEIEEDEDRKPTAMNYNRRTRAIWDFYQSLDGADKGEMKRSVADKKAKKVSKRRITVFEKHINRPKCKHYKPIELSELGK